MVDWTHWHNEPLLIGALVLASWIYALAVLPWRHRLSADAETPRAPIIRFACGILIFYLAVGSPLDQIGERFLFSAHMLQHMIIVYLVAPLILAGIPAWLLDAPLRRPALRGIARVLFSPVVAAVVYVLCMAVWHVPAAYDFALRDKLAHVIQHLMFLAAALVFWWPLASPSRLVPQKPPAVQMLYVFAAGVLQFPLVAFLSFSREPLYPTYAFAPRLVDLTPKEDQALGGALMGVGGMLIAIGLIARAFHQWAGKSPAIDPSPVVPNSHS
ncbi:MAG: cytochrome c oxidase assembly protein [Opitutaceae bacterium]